MSERRVMRSTSEVSGTRPAPLMPFPPGTLIAGKYCIERPLGEGATGCVVLARQRSDDAVVAVKVMHRRLAGEGATWFLREARAAARLQTEYVARVLDSGVLGDGTPFMVTEHLEGQSLEAQLEKRGRLPIPLAVSYIMQATEGLAEAHALGIVHGGLRPSNVFLSRRPDGGTRVKLLDFGIAKSAYGPRDDDAEAAEFGATAALYMPPEQLSSPSGIDRRADLWALGVLLHTMLAGQAPFEGETVLEVTARVMTGAPPSLRSLRPEVPAALEAVVLQCLEKEPHRRVRNVAAFAQAVEACATPGARKAAERIARILGGGEARSERPRALSAPVLPPAHFQDAVHDIERIVHGVAAPPSAPRSSLETPTPPAMALPPSETPPPVTTTDRPGAAIPQRRRVLGLAGAALAIAIAAGGATVLHGRGHAAAPPPPAPIEAPPPVAPPPPAPPDPPPVASEAPSAAPRRTPPRPASSSRPRKAAPATAPVGTTGFGGRE
jgi:serine/threonine-protein kinase